MYITFIYIVLRVELLCAHVSSTASPFLCMSPLSACMFLCDDSFSSMRMFPPCAYCLVRISPHVYIPLVFMSVLAYVFPCRRPLCITCMPPSFAFFSSVSMFMNVSRRRYLDNYLFVKYWAGARRAATRPKATSS